MNISVNAKPPILVMVCFSCLSLFFSAVAARTQAQGGTTGACTDTNGACAGIPGLPIKPAICGPIPDPCVPSPGYSWNCECENRKDSGNTHLCYCEAS